MRQSKYLTDESLRKLKRTVVVVVQKPVRKLLEAEMKDADDANVVAGDVADVGSRLESDGKQAVHAYRGSKH